MRSALLLASWFLIVGACAGPRIVLGGDERSVTAPAHPTQPPASVAQALDHPAREPTLAPQPVPAASAYVCPMHPEVTSTDPQARCPKCGMMLEAKK